MRADSLRALDRAMALLTARVAFDTPMQVALLRELESVDPSEVGNAFVAAVNIAAHLVADIAGLTGSTPTFVWQERAAEIAKNVG